MATEEQVTAVLSEIQSRIPKNILKAAFSEKETTPTIERVMRLALLSDKITDEKKKQIKTLLDSGEFSKKKIIENSKFTKMVDNFVSREINKAIKEGRLPPRSEIKNFSWVKHFNERKNKEN